MCRKQLYSRSNHDFYLYITFNLLQLKFVVECRILTTIYIQIKPKKRKNKKIKKKSLSLNSDPTENLVQTSNNCTKPKTTLNKSDIHGDRCGWILFLLSLWLLSSLEFKAIRRKGLKKGRRNYYQ